MTKVGKLGKGNILNGDDTFLGGRFCVLPGSTEILSFIVKPLLGQNSDTFFHRSTREEILQIVRANRGHNTLALVYKNTVSPFGRCPAARYIVLSFYGSIPAATSTIPHNTFLHICFTRYMRNIPHIRIRNSM